MTLAEKAAYLRGLMDGIKLDTAKDENRLLKAVVDLLQDMAVSIDDLEDNAIAVSDELDEIEENLDAIDEFLMDEDEDEFEDYDEFDDDEDYDFDEDDYEFDEDPVYEVTCPKCGEVHQFSEKDLLEGSKPCAKCGELLEFEFDEDDDEEMPF